MGASNIIEGVGICNLYVIDEQFERFLAGRRLFGGIWRPNIYIIFSFF